jgi:hypothetical protein
MAVAAAAESVMMELADLVRVFDWYGMRFMARSPPPVFNENSSATIRCGVDMPSPMKRNTYFGADPAKVAIAKSTPATNNDILYIFDIMLLYYTKTPDKLHISIIENMRYSDQISYRTPSSTNFA